MKRIFLSAAICSLVLISYSQNEVDALRYSFLYTGGPARSTAMGGSFGALGADFSSLSVNPAGVGLYRKNEFTFTPSFFHQRSTATYNGEQNIDDKYNFNFNNAGIIIGGKTLNDYKEENETGWKRVYFGFGYNRLSNYHNRIIISGENDENSLAELFANGSEGKYSDQLDPFGAGLAFNTFLIDTLPGSESSYTAAFPSGTNLRQTKTIETRGSYGETVINLAGNYSEKLFLGASFAFPRVRYIEESSYTEAEVVDSSSSFESYTYNQSLTTKGNGFTFKLGLIYKVSDWMRIGGAIHTPTILNMSDVYNNTLQTNFDNGAFYEDESPAGSFSYRIMTPMRAIGSMGFIVGKHGIINVDYEYVDYSYARLRSTPNVFMEQNKAIENKYTAVGNIKVGAEVKLAPITLRGGCAYYASPYRNNVNDAGRIIYSGGIGFREEKYFFDLAYQYSNASESYYLYDPENTNATNLDSRQTNFLVTVGLRF